jgi:hypothetical protein
MKNLEESTNSTEAGHRPLAFSEDEEAAIIRLIRAPGIMLPKEMS